MEIDLVTEKIWLSVHRFWQNWQTCNELCAYILYQMSSKWNKNFRKHW